MSECNSYAVIPPLSTYLWATFCGTKLPHRFSSVSGKQNSQSLAVVVVIRRVLMSFSSTWVHRESSTCWYAYSQSSFKFTALRLLLLTLDLPLPAAFSTTTSHIHYQLFRRSTVSNYNSHCCKTLFVWYQTTLQSAGLCDALAASPTSQAYVIVRQSGGDRVR